MCSGSSTSATKASVNAPSNQPHHPSYVNAACAGSDISAACHPPSLYKESLTSIQTSMVGKYQEAAPKPDGLIQSSTTSTLLASTPSMLPRWSLTDPSGRPLFADCQRSNPSKALKEGLYRIQILCRHHPFWSYPAGLPIAEVSPSLFTPLSPSLFTPHQILYRPALKRPCIEFGVVRIDSPIVVFIHSAIIQLLLTRRSAIVNPAG